MTHLEIGMYTTYYVDIDDPAVVKYLNFKKITAAEFVKSEEYLLEYLHNAVRFNGTRRSQLGRVLLVGETFNRELEYK